MVGDMLGKHDERNGNKRYCDFRNAARCYELGTFYPRFAACQLLNRLYKREVGIIQNCGNTHKVTRFVHEVVYNRRKIDYHEVLAVGRVAYRGENRRDYVACRNADDERNKLHHLVLFL